jgi:hypothetical protein
LAIVILGFGIATTHADKAGDRDFEMRIRKIFDDCQKVKPGMTRAELVKLKLFDEDRGPLGATNDNSFRQHTTFEYRPYSPIKIDVDFSHSDSKEARPTDIITNVSMPIIDGRARR